MGPVEHNSDKARLRPLAGVTLVEAYAENGPQALRLAGALAGRLAADLGARVVLANPEPVDAEDAARYAFLNAGKEYAPAGSALHDLLRDADVAVLDEGMASHAAQTPVSAVLSLFAADAPRLPASEFTIMALGGLLDIVGDPAREPLKLGGHQAAYAAGLSAYAGIAAALCRPKDHRRANPERVSVSLLDTIVWLNWKSVPAPASTEVPPSRAGAAAEWQVVRCADGWVALVYQENDWRTLCDVAGDERLLGAEFAERAERLKRPVELARIIEDSFKKRSRRELQAEALARRLPIGPVWSPRELLDDRQNIARDFLLPASGFASGAMIPRLPVIWGGTVFPPGGAPQRAQSHAGVASL